MKTIDMRFLDNPEFLRFMKYCVVGVLNTTVCLVTIYVCKSWIGVNPYLSNGIGYFLGLVNSFVWNKQWVFRSSNGVAKEAFRFAAGWAVCYAIQLWVVWGISHGDFGTQEFYVAGFVITGYGIATLIGAVVYTSINFLYNRAITFRVK